MKLKALDQVSISSVQADTIRKGQTFTVSDAFGEDLLKKLPNTLVRLDKPKPAPKPRKMAARKPQNKAAPPSENKAS